MSQKPKNSNRGAGDFLALIAFVSIMLIGLGLALSWLFGLLADTLVDFKAGRDVAAWIRHVAIAIALIVPLALSFREARRRKLLWFILWIIAVVLVVGFYILGIVQI